PLRRRRRGRNDARWRAATDNVIHRPGPAIAGEGDAAGQAPRQEAGPARLAHGPLAAVGRPITLRRTVQLRPTRHGAYWKGCQPGCLVSFFAAGIDPVVSTFGFCGAAILGEFASFG